MKVFMRSSLVVCGLLVILILVQSAPKSFGAKPRPPAPPPVRYQIQFFYSPGGGGYFNDFNNRSQAVGWFISPTDGQRRAWFYDPAVDPDDVVDLNTLVDPLDVPLGWILASAVGLNEHGDIVGVLEQIGDPSPQPVRRGYVLDMSTLDLNASPATPATLILIPDGAYGETYAKDLNNQGLVLGTYTRPDDTAGMYLYQAGLYGNPPDLTVTDLGLFVKNSGNMRLSETPPDAMGNRPPAQFAGDRLDGVAYRYTEGQPLDVFPELSEWSLSTIQNTNTAGGFCGTGIYNPPKGKSVRVPIRVLGAEPELITSLSGGVATALNRRGDLVLGYRALYWDAHGQYHINSLVTGDDATLAQWNAASIEINDLNDPDLQTGFGELAGRIFFADGTRGFFHLTPVPPAL